MSWRGGPAGARTRSLDDDLTLMAVRFTGHPEEETVEMAGQSTSFR